MFTGYILSNKIIFFVVKKENKESGTTARFESPLLKNDVNINC
jgi:hypothetical protein